MCCNRPAWSSVWLLLIFAVLAGCESSFSLNTEGATAFRQHTGPLIAGWSRKLQQSAPGTGCQVGAWGPYSDCVRTGINQWSRSRSRQVVKQGPNCPQLTDLVDCDPPRQPKPDDASGILQQTTLAMVTAIPLAITTALDDKSSNQAPGVGVGPEQEVPIPPGDIAAGRALWTEQASSYDRMTCLPFNGNKGLLSGASALSKSPAVQQALLKAENRARSAVAAARASFNVSQQKAIARTRIQSVNGELGSVVWDGDVTLGAQFKPDGAMSEPEAQLAVAVMADTVYNLMPWMVVQGELPPAGAMNLSVAYDSSAQAATLTSNSGDPLSLLSAIKLPLQYTYGLNPPSSPDSLTVASTPSSLRVSTDQGVQELAVSLDGDWTPSALSLRLGMPWVLPDDMFSIAPEPMVLYNAVPSVLYVAVTADVPAIGVTGMTSTLSFQPGQQVSLQLYGATNPIPHLTIADDLMLSARQGGGFISLTEGWLNDLPVSVAATITRGKEVSFTMTASTPTASVDNLVQTLFTPAQVPDFLLNFIKPIQFSQVTVTYTSNSSDSNNPEPSPSSSGSSSEDKGYFSMLAVPDIDGAPQLKQILNAIGLGVTDIALRSTGSTPESSTVKLGLQEPFELQLPDPFTKAGPTLLSLAQDQVTQAVVLTGSLPASITLPGMTNSIPLQVSTGVSTGAANAVTAHLTGVASSPAVAFSDFKFVQFGAMHLAASVSYAPLLLNQLTLSGAVTVFGVPASAIFTYDKPSKGLVFMAELPQLDLQLLAQSVGARVKQGNLNAQLTGVRQTYAAAAAPSMAVPSGMVLAGDLAFSGMQSRVQFEVTPDGVGFVAAFNSSQFSQAFKGLVASKLQGILQSAAAAAQQTSAAAAGQAGAPNQAEANAAQLDKYMSDLLQAQQQFGVASNAFDAAKKKAVDSLAAAQTKSSSAVSAFDALRKKRGQALDDAAGKYRAADVALAAAEVKAFGDLEDAIEALGTAQTEFTAAVSDALVDVEIAQTAANELKSSYNSNNSRCDAWPWTQSNCEAAASGWTAYQVAASQLVSAASELQAVSSGAPYVKLAAARNSLTDAQKAVKQMASGSKWVSREAARAALSAAKDAAAALNGSSEAGALAAANKNLRAAQAALSAAVDGSAEWLALNAAKSALEAAEAQMTAAQAADKETVDTCKAAVEGLTLAQQEVQTENFLQLTSLAVNFNLKRDSTMLFAYYDITVASQQLRGRFAVDVNNTPEDIKLMLLGALKSEAVVVLKAKYPTIQQFMV